MADTLLKEAVEKNDRQRLSRTQETRDAEPIHEPSGDDQWQQPMMTSAPEARPGFVQRWVRISTLGTDDVSNMMRKRNEGWNPRAADTVPPGFFCPTVQHARYGEVISNGDMILMERPENIHQRQKEFIDRLTRNQTSGIERYLSQTMPGGHGFSAGEVDKFERKISTGRRPKIADD